MIPIVALSAFLTIAVLVPAPRLVPGMVTVAATLAASPAKTSHDADDDWIDRALANQDWTQPCDDGGNDGREVYCVVREFPYTADGKPIAFDGGDNSGVDVQGWDRPTVRVLYRVKARARSQERAKEIAESIDVVRTGGKVRPDGPSTHNPEWWSVEFKVWVPRSSNLWLHTVNGPLGVQDVRGTMDLVTINGPLSLVNLGGAVEARATNGPLHVQLEGTRWQGAGLDASTQNGPVNFVLPRTYSARVETGTINGPQTIEYALTLQRLTRGHLILTLGSGGPPVRVVTDNGPFHMGTR